MAEPAAHEEVVSLPSVNLILRGAAHPGHLKLGAKGFSFKVIDKAGVQLKACGSVESAWTVP
jgi:hypothetical protein